MRWEEGLAKPYLYRVFHAGSDTKLLAQANRPATKFESIAPKDSGEKANVSKVFKRYVEMVSRVSEEIVKVIGEQDIWEKIFSIIVCITKRK